MPRCAEIAGRTAAARVEAGGERPRGPCGMELQVTVDGRHQSDVLFGDRFGVSADESLTTALERLFGPGRDDELRGRGAARVPWPRGQSRTIAVRTTYRRGLRGFRCGRDLRAARCSTPGGRRHGGRRAARDAWERCRVSRVDRRVDVRGSRRRGPHAASPVARAGPAAASAARVCAAAKPRCRACDRVARAGGVGGRAPVRGRGRGVASRGRGTFRPRGGGVVRVCSRVPTQVDRSRRIAEDGRVPPAERSAPPRDHADGRRALARLDDHRRRLVQQVHRAEPSRAEPSRAEPT
jgi:hypothetical protein